MLRKLVIFIVFSSIFLSSCGPATLNVQVKRPAEVNISNFKKIAVSDIEGQFGSDIADLLTEALFASGQYEVLDRAHIKNIIQEQNLSKSGLIDENTSAQLGKLLGSSAMIFGRVAKVDFNDEKVTEGSGVDGSGAQFTTYTRYGIVTLTVNFKVTDLTTGRIIATKNLTKEISGTLSGEKNRLPPRIDPTNLYDSAKKEVVSQFMKMIATYTENVVVNIEDNDQIPTMVSGVNKAKLSQWKEAMADFILALEEVKNHPKFGADPKEIAKVLYNIGVCYSYSGDYDNAIKYFTEAYSKNPKDYYQLEINRCKKYKEEKRKLEEQGISNFFLPQPHKIVIRVVSK